MFFKRKIIFIGLVATFFCLVACSSKTKYDGAAICFEFYTLNKNKDLNFFRRLRILETREYSIYDNKNTRNTRIPLSIVVCARGNVILIPSYSQNADIFERQVFYNRCDTTVLSYLDKKYHVVEGDDDLFKYYQIEIDSIYQEYAQVEIPSLLPYNNIPIIGHDSYIEFVLLEDEKNAVFHSCYLVIDSLGLNRQDKIRLAKFHRIDERWYCNNSVVDL